VFLTFVWLRPEGALLYEAFMREQLSDGGVFQSALAEGMITSSLQELQLETSVTAWQQQQIVCSDVMSMIHFEVNDVAGV
jgi:hypothetical protein